MSFKNRTKALGLVVMAAAALTAFAAQGASAENWTDASLLKSGESREAFPTLAAGTPAALTGVVSGLNVKLTANKLEGIEAKIIQEGTGASGVAAASGKLKFSELTLDEPAGCVAPTSVTTTALKGSLRTTAGLTSGLGFTFKPVSGTLFATITLTGSCAIAGTPFKVTTQEANGFCAETEKIGTMLVKQPLRSSATINSNCGGTLFTGGNAAALDATGHVTLKGEPSWGAQ
jgi:hypothetical protein